MIPDTHPSLPGHFPKNPIIPGVVTLDYIARGLLKQMPGTSLVGFPQVKFLLPLLPDALVTVVYKFHSDDLYQFYCECNGDKVLSGKIHLAQSSKLA